MASTTRSPPHTRRRLLHNGDNEEESFGRMNKINIYSRCDANLEATRDMCIWCFELLCYKLRRYDLVSDGPKNKSDITSSDSSYYDTDGSNTSIYCITNQETRNLSNHSQGCQTPSDRTLCLPSTASSTVGGSTSSSANEASSSSCSSHSSNNEHYHRSQRNYRYGWKSILHRHTRDDTKAKHHINCDDDGYSNSRQSKKREASSTRHSPDSPLPPRVIRLHAARNSTAPLFVTWMCKNQSDQWTTVNPSSLSLRGCIGSLDPVPITDLATYADKAAFHDRRFDPINQSEIDHLECRVSILKDFEPCLTPYDWDIDIHGLTVNFSHPNGEIGRKYQATFLPGVAKEHNMTYRKTLEELIRKAGYRGIIDENFISTLHVTRYKASKHRLTFVEFQEELLSNRKKNRT